jgi:hypothetical protein
MALDEFSNRHASKLRRRKHNFLAVRAGHRWFFSACVRREIADLEESAG